MWRDLRVTLVILIGVAILASPIIFAAPGPANTNYLALVMHIVAPTNPPTATTTAVPTSTGLITPTPTATRTPLAPTATKPPIGPTATPTLPPPTYNNCQADPNPNAAPNYPIRITEIDKSAETVTLKNVSTGAIDLSGWNMCSVTGNQHHPISGTLAAGTTATFANTGGPIWNNATTDPGALYTPGGQLVSYSNN